MTATALLSAGTWVFSRGQWLLQPSDQADTSVHHEKLVQVQSASLSHLEDPNPWLKEALSSLGSSKSTFRIPARTLGHALFATEQTKVGNWPSLSSTSRLTFPYLCKFGGQLTDNDNNPQEAYSAHGLTLLGTATIPEVNDAGQLLNLPHVADATDLHGLSQLTLDIANEVSAAIWPILTPGQLIRWKGQLYLVRQAILNAKPDTWEVALQLLPYAQ